MNELIEQIRSKFEQATDKINFLNQLRKEIFKLSPENQNPVDLVQWIPLDKIRANNYNPNSVARQEMELLYTSIREDGYTQPVVAYYDETQDIYIIVDGFHRNLVGRRYKDIYQRCHGMLPIVVIDKDINDRMASTVRHNRARGKHSLDGMVNIIYNMIKDGKSEYEICNKLGLEPRELVRLKYITGFAKMFKNYEFEKAIECVAKEN